MIIKNKLEFTTKRQAVGLPDFRESNFDGVGNYNPILEKYLVTVQTPPPQKGVKVGFHSSIFDDDDAMLAMQGFVRDGRFFWVKMSDGKIRPAIFYNGVLDFAPIYY